MIRIFSGPGDFEVNLTSPNIEPNPNSSSNILLTISNSKGENSLLVTQGKVIETKAKYFLEAPKERVIVKQKAWVRYLQMALKAAGFALVTSLVALSVFSFTGDVKARIVLTGSMAPAINAGDIIITVPPSKKTPVEGDVVAYFGKRFDGSQVGVFSHRIIGGDAQNGFIVKGDANPSPDVQRPTTSDITGVVVLVIPFIGRLLSPRTLLVMAPIIIGIWLVYDALRDE
jgi:signal peptidase I